MIGLVAEFAMQGELQEGATVNVFVSAEWIAVQTMILSALEPHPAARQAVADALGANHAGRA